MAYRYVRDEVEMRERLNEKRPSQLLHAKMSNKRYTGIRDPDEAPEAS